MTYSPPQTQTPWNQKRLGSTTHWIDHPTDEVDPEEALEELRESLKASHWIRWMDALDAIGKREGGKLTNYRFH